MKKYLSVIMVLALLLTTGVSYAESIGVNSHIGHGVAWKASLEQVQDMNISWIRDGKNWSGIMSDDGTFSMPEDIIDYYDNAKKNGIKTMYTIGYGYAGDKYGYSDNFHIPLKSDTDYFNDFIKMVEFVAATMKGKVDAYEIWNEPDHTDMFNLGKATAAQYKDLLEASYKAIKKIDPDALVLNGGIAWKTEFLDALLAGGGGNYMDAVAVHQYNHGDAGPEKNFRKCLDSYLSVLNKYNYAKPIWLTENGWYTGSSDKAPSRENQGAYLIRNSVIWGDFLKDNNRTGIYMWYDLSDDGLDQANGEHNYGLTGYDIYPKPSGKSAKIYNSLVGDMDFVTKTEPQTATYKGGFLNLETIKCYGHLAEYQNTVTGEKTYIAWDTNGRNDTKLSVPLSGEYALVYDYQGKLLQTINNPSGNLELTVTDKPLFVACENTYANITDLEYDTNRSIAKIKGNASHLNSVTISAYANDDEGIYNNDFNGLKQEEWLHNDNSNPWRHWNQTSLVTVNGNNMLKVNPDNVCLFNLDSLGVKYPGKYKITAKVKPENYTLGNNTDVFCVYTEGGFVGVNILAQVYADNATQTSRHMRMYNAYTGGVGTNLQNSGDFYTITMEWDTESGAVKGTAGIDGIWMFNKSAEFARMTFGSIAGDIKFRSGGSALYIDDVKVIKMADKDAFSNINVPCDKNGDFETEISIDKEGSITIYAGKTELETIESTRYATKEFNAEWEGKKQSNPQTAEISGVGIIVAEDTVSVNGNINGVYDGETLNILAVPKNKEATDYVYMNEVNVENGEFSHSFKLNCSGEYTLYLTTTNSASIESTGFGIDGVSVADFVIGEENNKVTASATVASHNYDDTKTVLIIAQYDENGTLLSADISEKGVPETGVKTFSTSKNIGAKKVHAFIWKSLDEMYPLAESIKL